MLHFASYQFHPATRDLELFFAGCSVQCAGCHNEELWDKDKYPPVYPYKILCEVEDYLKVAKRVLIMGGEPLEQDMNSMVALLISLKKKCKEIWLFTSHELMYVPEQYLNVCDFVKTGEFALDKCSDMHYIHNTAFGKMKLASTNQKIYEKGVDY